MIFNGEIVGWEKFRHVVQSGRSNFFAKLMMAGLLAAGFSLKLLAGDLPELRPSVVPLVACDPYFSIWSPADHLGDADTMHWTRHPQRLESLIRIDGKAYRLMGTEPNTLPALRQTSLNVLPTRTIYTFAGAGIELGLTFMTPALPDDLMIYSRPVTYLTWTAKANDGQAHAVQVYFDASAEITVDIADQKVTQVQTSVDGLDVLGTGSADQSVLGKRGDDLRIDWGHLYVAMPAAAGAFHVNCQRAEVRDEFVAQGVAGLTGVTPMLPISGSQLVSAFAFDFGQVADQEASRWLILAYDDEYSIQYFRQNLRPYWRRNGDDAAALLKKSADEYPALVKRCAQFDDELMADLRAMGGEKYARLCALLFRQVVAGTKLAADANGQPLLFPKENTSNGCIGTVDVIYPMSPFFLMFGPSLTKAMIVPALDYASSPRWKFSFAPHDLGTYPLANGQVYGGGERTEDDQMPVEETANIMILTAALTQMEGNADFAARYWPVLEKWSVYLKAKGFDPERQLCTDDFAGHLAHNVNLSAKAIVALGAYGQLCQARGLNDAAKEFHQLAQEYAVRWAKDADDGDHFRLAYDQPGTWSQKYNLIWDRVLGLNLFPDDVMRKEMSFYPRVMDRYGLALDNRKPYAELPWSFWTASLTGDRADFERLFNPVYDYTDETLSRVPFADFYWTKTGSESGMHARPVIGGIFIRSLLTPEIWHKWAGRDTTKSANWAPLPPALKTTVVVPAADTKSAVWRYTTTQPAEGWTGTAFDASAWMDGVSGFGSADVPGGVVKTPWKTDDIWLRREISLPEGDWSHLQAWLHHDEDIDVYINGVLAFHAAGWTTSYDAYPLTPEGLAAVKPGDNLIAVHCHQTTGGQYVDVGFVNVQPAVAVASEAK